MTDATSILHFWLEELSPKQHFVKDAALDETIRTRFGNLLAAAAKCELFAWRATAAGRLAEIIVLDQFSRNVYRATKQAFAKDALAHTQAVALFTQLGIQGNLDFALRHQAIIDRFGRYPHRNAILGRSSSAEELAFLAEPGSSF
jgi:uncharacterized protein (DUF924 family)